MHNFISKYTRYTKKQRNRFGRAIMRNFAYNIPDDVKNSGTDLKE